MKRSKVIYDKNNEAKGVIYLHRQDNLVGCGVYVKPAFQVRPVNITTATGDAKIRAFRVLEEKQRGLVSFSTLGTVIDLNKVSYSFEELWKMSRVVVEDNHPYIMF